MEIILALYLVMVPYGQASLTATTSAGFVIRILDFPLHAMLDYHTIQNVVMLGLNDTCFSNIIKDVKLVVVVRLQQLVPDFPI